jgi:hypothetical protein
LPEQKSFVRKLGRIAVSTLLLLVGFDVVGVAAGFFCETIVGPRKTSTALYYAIWFVLGVFCGLLCYFANSGEDPKRPDTKTGLLAVLTTPLILGALCFLFYRLFWRLNMAPSVYVPDNEGLTLTFFITVAVAMAFTHHVETDKPTKVKGR